MPNIYISDYEYLSREELLILIRHREERNKSTVSLEQKYKTSDRISRASWQNENRNARRKEHTCRSEVQKGEAPKDAVFRDNLLLEHHLGCNPTQREPEDLQKTQFRDVLAAAVSTRKPGDWSARVTALEASNALKAPYGVRSSSHAHRSRRGGSRNTKRVPVQPPPDRDPMKARLPKEDCLATKNTDMYVTTTATPVNSGEKPNEIEPRPNTLEDALLLDAADVRPTVRFACDRSVPIFNNNVIFNNNNSILKNCFSIYYRYFWAKDKNVILNNLNFFNSTNIVGLFLEASGLKGLSSNGINFITDCNFNADFLKCLSEKDPKAFVSFFDFCDNVDYGKDFMAYLKDKNLLNFLFDVHCENAYKYNFLRDATKSTFMMDMINFFDPGIFKTESQDDNLMAANNLV